MSMLRKIALALSAAFLLSASAFAQAPQIGAGQVFGNSTAAQRNGRSETVTAIFDRALGATRGAIIERGAGGWALVGPGATAGLAWISAGTGADPGYGVLGLVGGGCNAALVASNGGILYSTANACSILAGTATARLPLLSGASTTPQWGAYTLPASVTSGGIPFFSSTTVQGSSALLAANQIMLGGGAGVAPSTLGSLGTTTTVLHGNAAGAPTFSALNFATDGTGQVPIANGGTGQATAATAISALMPTPTRAGDLAFWNGTNWVTLAGNNSGTQVLSENASGVPSWVAASGTGTVTSVVIAGTAGNIAVSGTCTITATGTCTIDLAASRKTNPAGCAINATATVTCADGSAGANNGTYTTPTGALWLEIEGVGGGGGGCGSGTTPGAAGAGGATTFGTGPIASSGTAAACSTSTGGTGGTPTGGFVNKVGGNGASPNGTSVPGGAGCVGPFGGGGQPGGAGANAGSAAVANSGSGGGGAGAGTTASPGGGGGCGGLFRLIVSGALNATYPYAVAGTASGGTAGTSGAAGGAGGSGYLQIIPHFN